MGSENGCADVSDSHPEITRGSGYQRRSLWPRNNRPTPLPRATACWTLGACLGAPYRPVILHMVLTSVLRLRDFLTWNCYFLGHQLGLELQRHGVVRTEWPLAWVCLTSFCVNLLVLALESVLSRFVITSSSHLVMAPWTHLFACTPLSFGAP